MPVLCFPDLLIVIADPDGDGCAPVTISWNGPVACVSQPVPKTLLTHKLWNPKETETTLHYKTWSHQQEQWGGGFLLQWHNRYINVRIFIYIATLNLIHWRTRETIIDFCKSNSFLSRPADIMINLACNVFSTPTASMIIMSKIIPLLASFPPLHF